MKEPVRSLITCALLGAQALVAAQPAPDGWLRRGVTRDGTWFDAALRAVSATGEVEFAEPPPGRTLPLSELILWGGYRDRPAGTRLVLVDGSVLVAELLHLDAQAVTIVSPLWAETRLPRELIGAIIFRPPSDADQRDRLYQRAVATDRGEERLLLENGDELGGRLPDAVPLAPGAFRLTQLQWVAREGGPADTLPLDRVLAVLLVPAQRADAADQTTRTLVGLRDGSQLFARTLQAATDHLEFELVTGPRLVTLPVHDGAETLWAPVVSLQPFTPHVVYLSDLDAISYRHIPFLDTPWPYQRDRSVSGGRQRHAGCVWAKGLGMHAASRLAYEPRGEYREFQAEVALDDSVGRLGSVIFRVYVQGADPSWRLAYESGIVRGGDAATPVRVDIRDAQRVALLVDYADRADQGDHANWLNARFLR
jgi:hypothetical protein